MAGVSSQGTSFTFTGLTASATQITVSDGDQNASQQRQRISAAYLDSDPRLPEPYIEIWQPDPGGSGALSDGGASKRAQISYIGQTMPSVGATGNLSISGKLSYTFSATVLASSVTASVGEVVRGEVTFAVR